LGCGFHHLCMHLILSHPDWSLVYLYVYKNQ
jgi:hypothetical protein